MNYIVFFCKNGIIITYMTNTYEKIDWVPINFRTFSGILLNAYIEGFQPTTLDNIANNFKGETEANLQHIIQHFGLDQYKNWGMCDGNGAVITFANPIESSPISDESQPYKFTIQNTPATLVLRRRLESQRPVADVLSVATTANFNGTPRIIAASYEAQTGALHRVNISTPQVIKHQGIKVAPTKPENFMSHAGFVTERMVIETQHRSLVDIIYSEDYGIRIVGDIHNRVSQSLELDIKNKDGVLFVKIEDAKLSLPVQI